MTTKIERVPSFFESISKEVFRNQKENEEVQLLILDMKWRHGAIIRTPGVANTCRRSLKGSHKLMRGNLSTVLADEERAYPVQRAPALCGVWGRVLVASLTLACAMRGDRDSNPGPSGHRR